MADLKNYLDDLASALRHNLPPAEAEAILIETESHLRDRIEALMELGLTMEEAERDAVIGFGPSGSLARELRQAHEPSRSAMSRWLLRLSLLATAVAVPTPIIAVWSASGYLFLLALPLLIVLGALSFRFRKFLPLPIGISALVAAASVTLLYSALVLPLRPFGGYGLIAIRDVRQVRSAIEADLRFEGVASRIVNDGREIVESANPAEAMQHLGYRDGGAYRYPTGVSFAGASGVVFRNGSPIEAAEGWRTHFAFVTRQLRDRTYEARQELRAIREATATPYLRRLAMVAPQFTDVWQIWALLLFGAHAAGAFLGWLMSRMRRIRITIQMAAD